MKKALVAGVLLLGAMIFSWQRDHAPAPAEVERVPVIYPTPGPIVDEPLEPTRPPAEQPQPTPFWGPCADQANKQRVEDEWLRRVLASTVEGDPLFGIAPWYMDAASCAARRWRLAGR